MSEGQPDLDKLAREGSAKVGQVLLQKRLKAEEGQICLPPCMFRALLERPSYHCKLHFAIVMSLSVQECVIWKW